MRTRRAVSPVVLFLLGLLPFLAPPSVVARDKPKPAGGPPPVPNPAAPQVTGAQILKMKLAFLPKVVAKIDKTEITADEFRKMAAPQLLQYVMRGRNMSQDQLKGLVVALLRDYVDRRLLALEAQKAGFKPDLKQARAKLEQLAGRFGGMQGLSKILQWQGLSVDDAVRQIAMDMAVSAWVEKKLKPRVAVSDDEVRKYYQQHQKEFMEPEKVQASHILIESRESDTPEQKAKARAEAEKVLKLLKAGGDFAELARKYSACPSAKRGGDLGYFKHGDMVPEFDKAAFALKEGEISGIVHTKFGYHIIKGGKHKPAHEQSFAAVKDRIRDQLTRPKLVALLKKEIERARTAHRVQILVKAPVLPRPPQAEPPSKRK